MLKLQFYDTAIWLYNKTTEEVQDEIASCPNVFNYVCTFGVFELAELIISKNKISTEHMIDGFKYACLHNHLDVVQLIFKQYSTEIGRRNLLYELFPLVCTNELCDIAQWMLCVDLSILIYCNTSELYMKLLNTNPSMAEWVERHVPGSAFMSKISNYDFI
tara:strand:+ start:1543 stop:2025 length:483 start_codon:yes stop_codon:yes gene_type:complete